MRPALALSLLLASCRPEAPAASDDQRIDGASEENDPDSVSPRMCLTDDGDLHVAWVDDRDGVAGIWVSSSADGSDWSAPIRVDHGTVGASVPSLACSGGGLFLAWEDVRDGMLDAPNIYVNRSEDGGATWQADDLRLGPDENGFTHSEGPAIVAAGDRVHVAWFDDENGAYDVFLASSADRGVTWLPIQRVDDDDPGAAYSAWPRVQADADGHVVVVWEDSREGATDLYARTSFDGGATLWPEIRIDGGDAPGSHDSFAPSIAADDGTVYVVWHDQRSGEKRDVFANWSVNFGQNWATDAVRIDTDEAGSTDSLQPDVVVRDGVATIAWQDARSSAYDVFVRDVEAGWGPDPEARLDKDAPGAANSVAPQILREGDTLVVLWEDRRDAAGDGMGDLYYSYSLDGGATWSETDLRIDSAEAGESTKGDIAAALDGGRIHVAWEDDRDGTSDIWFQSLAVGETSQPDDP